jgi:hypothetical protein
VIVERFAEAVLDDGAPPTGDPYSSSTCASGHNGDEEQDEREHDRGDAHPDHEDAGDEGSEIKNRMVAHRSSLGGFGGVPIVARWAAIRDPLEAADVAVADPMRGRMASSSPVPTASARGAVDAVSGAAAQCIERVAVLVLGALLRLRVDVHRQL